MPTDGWGTGEWDAEDYREGDPAVAVGVVDLEARSWRTLLGIEEPHRDDPSLPYEKRLAKRMSTALMIALLALVFLNFADVVTTRWILAIGPHNGVAGVEADPISRLLLNGYRVEIIKIVLLSLAERRRSRMRVSVGMVCAGWFVAGVYGMVILNNVMALNKLLAG
jgi:hypothetical protein